MAVWSANPVLMFRSMDVNGAVAGISVLGIQSLQPENSSRYEVPRVRQRIVWPQRAARFENGAGCRAVTDFFCDAEIAEGRLIAALLGPNSKTGTGNGK